MKDDRRKQIEALVARREAVTIEELREEFGVSMNTIRSDVAYLADTGAVEKVYGGVRALVRREEVPAGLELERASVEDIILFMVKGAKK